MSCKQIEVEAEVPKLEKSFDPVKKEELTLFKRVVKEFKTEREVSSNLPSTRNLTFYQDFTNVYASASTRKS